jgi:hypothetical protein
MTSESQTGRRWHDLGGTEAGPVDLHEHDHALWEKRVDALRAVASERGFFTVDGLRRVLEDMGEQAFETMSYYERWMAATTQNLIEAGAFTIEELNARMEAVRARGPTYGEAQGEARGDAE